MSGLQKILQPTIYENRLIFINGYSLMHILLFFLLGSIYPNKWNLVITGVIAFEVFEFMMAKKGGIEAFNWHPIISGKDTISDITLDLFGYWMAHNV